MKMLPFEEVSFKKKEVHGQTLGLANEVFPKGGLFSR
jgi:hypothetical protein